MVGYEYEFIRGIQSTSGLKWEFKDDTYNKGFIDVLNILGDDGWQITVKTSDFKYILMRKK